MPRRLREDAEYDQDAYVASCHPRATYFLQGSSGGPIKIGKTNNIRMRLMNLQPGNPDLLVCLGLSTKVKEHEVHKLFEDDRVFGEWFADSPKLRAFIDECKDE